jgi:hypothetical protein
MTYYLKPLSTPLPQVILNSGRLQLSTFADLHSYNCPYLQPYSTQQTCVISPTPTLFTDKGKGEGLPLSPPSPWVQGNLSLGQQQDMDYFHPSMKCNMGKNVQAWRDFLLPINRTLTSTLFMEPIH